MSPLVWDLGHIAAYEDLWLAPPPRRHGAAAPGPRRPLRRLRDAPRGPRRDRGARPREARAYLRAGARAHRAGRRAETGSATACCSRWCCDTSSSTARRCARRWPSPGCCPAGEPALSRSAERRRMAERPRRALRDGRRPRPASPTTTSALATPSSVDGFQIARAARQQRQLDALQRGRRLRAARVVVGRGLGLEAGVRHHPSSGDRRGSGSRHRPATSPGSRPTPSPARTMRACLPSRSGRGRRPGPRPTRARRRSPASGRCGSGPPRTSTATPGFARPPLPRVLRGLLRRATTGSCAAARGRRTRVWRR